MPSITYTLSARPNFGTNIDASRMHPVPAPFRSVFLPDIRVESSTTMMQPMPHKPAVEAMPKCLHLEQPCF